MLEDSASHLISVLQELLGEDGVWRLTDISIDAPEIAENGNAVPVSVSAPGAVAIMILGAGNPEPVIARVAFGPAAGAQTFATRVRLARTQDVVALAKLADGSVIEARAAVKVTIGGCGG